MKHDSIGAFFLTAMQRRDVIEHVSLRKRDSIGTFFLTAMQRKDVIDHVSLRKRDSIGTFFLIAMQRKDVLNTFHYVNVTALERFSSHQCSTKMLLASICTDFVIVNTSKTS